MDRIVQVLFLPHPIQVENHNVESAFSSFLPKGLQEAFFSIENKKALRPDGVQVEL